MLRHVLGDTWIASSGIDTEKEKEEEQKYYFPHDDESKLDAAAAAEAGLQEGGEGGGDGAYEDDDGDSSVVEFLGAFQVDEANDDSSEDSHIWSVVVTMLQATNLMMLWILTIIYI